MSAFKNTELDFELDVEFEVWKFPYLQQPKRYTLYQILAVRAAANFYALFMFILTIFQETTPDGRKFLTTVTFKDGRMVQHQKPTKVGLSVNLISYKILMFIHSIIVCLVYYRTDKWSRSSPDG